MLPDRLAEVASTFEGDEGTTQVRRISIVELRHQVCETTSEL